VYDSAESYGSMRLWTDCRYIRILPDVRHFLFFLYILLLSSGFAGITFTIILVKRLKEPVLTWMLAVISLFTVWLMLSLVGYYIELMSFTPVFVDSYFSGITFVLGILIYAGICCALISVYPAMSRVWAYLAASPLVLLYLYVAAAVLLSSRFPGLSSVPRSVMLPFSVAATGVFLTFAGYIFLKGSTGASQDTMRFLLRWLGRLLLIFVPVSLILTAGGLTMEFAGSPTELLNYLVFFIWNILSIAAFIRYLVKPAALIDEGKVSEGFIRAFGISPREAEVVDLISHGLSNKEIASALHVSFTTARTHVYNIFRKTGASSRVELLRVVSGYRE